MKFQLNIDQGEEGRKIKLITVTNRIEWAYADYATDYIKIKDLALKKTNYAIGKWFDEK
jgi:peptidyl-prolyl cis-trans isomerase SurA